MAWRYRCARTRAHPRIHTRTHARKQTQFCRSTVCMRACVRAYERAYERACARNSPTHVVSVFLNRHVNTPPPPISPSDGLKTRLPSPARIRAHHGVVLGTARRDSHGRRRLFRELPPLPSRCTHVSRIRVAPDTPPTHPPTHPPTGLSSDSVPPITGAARSTASFLPWPHTSPCLPTAPSHRPPPAGRFLLARRRRKRRERSRRHRRRHN